MRINFKNAKISALVTIIPEIQINIDDELNTTYNGDKKKLDRIKNAMGLQYKHIVNNKTSVSDLSQYGVKLLCDEYELDKNTIDAIVVITQTPDFFIPATACYLHGKLDLPQTTLAFDINQSCTGFVYGLYILFSMIENGGCKRILMICGDIGSQLDNKTNNKSTKIVGDGVSVSLLELSNHSCESFFELGVDGKNMEYLFVPYGAFKRPTKHMFDDTEWFNKQNKEIYMNGLEIFNFATQKEPEAFKSILNYANCTKNELDYIFFHQANKTIVDIITQRLQLDPNKTPNNIITKYGNLSGASIPATICDWLNTAQKPLEKSLKIALGSFGAGLSWANAILELDKNFWCKKTQIYKQGETLQ
ncbi:TPA: 3-oxoacyl-[acyl-carrier-protein] synthase III C-terminal domain-containing protein [Campylobacter lari]|uniref:3-oxoacyl-[acyl-carrier-protein] synthase III C-terminal domain-containing protein n=1 Tax=Campylobacter lari TaxID=201 RepID=UPI0017A6A1E5|nr:3-oxoacyl-[acyl-carrier-protein] synthase III C-terminal domain-containing protein [Campylobacter lari]EAI4828557.1 beta-ketoacyl-ACP synthase III [Campylobacter lari]EAI7268984.1 beta-ketoacyl-ACP synthase III [Campylobacter lari]MCV3368151.1 beta-ketoacyl-ACP synthase III [Campylobacter lari]MCW0187086.1 beta-ketoacyl-ACP synthase III [Campylobacter lari]MCW0231248.1 beta-ketoacyl-ACP synthase III [Campylobacter lari]